MKQKSNYVLVDSWFSKDFIHDMRGIKNQMMHVICAVRKDWGEYIYQGRKMNAKELFKVLKNKGKEKTVSQAQHALFRSNRLL